MDHPNELKSRSSIFFQCLIINIGALTSGIFFSSFNAAFFETLNLYQDPHTDQKLLIASLTSAIPLGGILGGIIACLFALRLGRRKLMMVADLLTIIGCIVSQSSTLSIALVGRTICGFICGVNFLLVPLYIRELLPYYMVTRTVIFFKVMFSLGMCLTFLISLFSQNNGNEQNLWKLVFLLPILFAFIRLVGLVSCVKTDTATFYMKRNQNDKAWEVLKSIYKDQFVDEAYIRERKMSIMFRFRDAFTAEYRSQVLRALVITLFAQLMGGNLLTFYSSRLFLGHQSDANAQTYIDICTLNVFFAVITVFANLPGNLILQHIGRRPLLVYGAVILGASSLLIAFSEVVNFIIGQNSLIIIFAIVQSITFNLVSRAYAYELLPSYSLVFQVIFEMLGAAGLGFVFAYLELELAFLVVAVFCALGFLVSYKIVRETKDMIPSEIHSVFKPNTQKKDQVQPLLDEEASSCEGDTIIESVKIKESIKSNDQDEITPQHVLLR